MAARARPQRLANFSGATTVSRSCALAARSSGDRGVCRWALNTAEIPVEFGFRADERGQETEPDQAGETQDIGDCAITVVEHRRRAIGAHGRHSGARKRRLQPFIASRARSRTVV